MNPANRPLANQRLWWALPLLVCIALYWNGLWAWFAQDDFAWLGLRRDIHQPSDVWRVLFQPMAQGTIRPLSERGFFLLFESIFGLDAFPFRLWVMLTQLVNLLLLASVATRIFGSRLAGVAAPLLWLVNAGLASPMSWTSAYNQILLSFFLLLSFRFWLRYTETGERRFYVAQWVTFVLGFGANELNVVYPALAALWALCCTRNYLWKTVPMFAVSAAYAIVHRAVAVKPSTGVYAMHWDWSVFATLRTYVKWALGPEWVRMLGGRPEVLLKAAEWVLVLALVGFFIYKLARREWLAGFCAAWFLLPLAPVLPLRDHLTHYYLSVPALGLALLGALALRDAWRSRWVWRVAAVALLLLYAGSNAAVAYKAVAWARGRSEEIRTLVGSVAYARERHPNAVLVLEGLTSTRFWGTFMDNPFRLLDIRELYLAPGAEESIDAHPELANVADHTIPEAVLAKALASGAAVIYDASGTPLRNITSAYARRFFEREHGSVPASIDVGSTLYAEYVGDGWHAIENGHRWMSKHATLRIGAPKEAKGVLQLSGYATADFLRGGGVSLHVRVDGQAVGTVSLAPGDESFSKELALPRSVLDRDQLEISLDCSRSFTVPNDSRELTFIFGRIVLR